jgi:PBSX family phage terminase large subunit
MVLLHPSQNTIASDTHRYRVVNCGRQFGKTTLSVEEMKGVALKKNASIVYIAPTIQQARDIAWNMLKNELSSITVKSNEAPSLEMQVHNNVGGISVIKLRGWEAVETLRGQQFDLIILDEVASMRNFWLNWQEVLIPTLTFRQGHAMFISTPKGFNHFYDLYNFESKDADFKSFHFTSYDNPYLKPEELEKTKSKTTEDRFAQEYMADFRKQEGLVYKEFNRDTHTFDDTEQIERAEFFGTIDFGFTNPCAVLSIAVDKDSNYWVIDEWYKTGRTEDQIGDYVKTQGYNFVYPDPENPSAIEVLNRKGINVYEVVKGKGSIATGINSVRALFKQNRLHIHKRCTNLINELETYAYPEKRPNNNEPEVPVKENDHAVDSLRYGLVMHQSVAVSPLEEYMLAEARRNSGSNFAR